MAIFTRAIEVDGDARGERQFEAEGPKAAIRVALAELQTVVSDAGDLTSAIIVVGEGLSAAQTRWLGGWLWRAEDGFVWMEPD